MPKTIIHERIERDFRYHAPTSDQVERYQLIRDGAKDLMHQMTDCCPESRELSLAYTHLQQAVMWANASIAVNETNAS